MPPRLTEARPRRRVAHLHLDLLEARHVDLEAVAALRTAPAGAAAAHAGDRLRQQPVLRRLVERREVAWVREVVHVDAAVHSASEEPRGVKVDAKDVVGGRAERHLGGELHRRRARGGRTLRRCRWRNHLVLRPLERRDLHGAVQRARDQPQRVHAEAAHQLAVPVRDPDGRGGEGGIAARAGEAAEVEMVHGLVRAEDALLGPRVEIHARHPVVLPPLRDLALVDARVPEAHGTVVAAA
mmetsp:Transcript_36257/g.104266  ORF Transcript_36257/g.104266 Transcript_36257/m.104266 type:complete len:240 (-) Transcript_36257:914-1633(-)